jgi:hypothetical protein
MFPGGKGDQWPYHFHVPIVLKSGSFNLPEPLGPVQACNGIALPYHFYSINYLLHFCLTYGFSYIFIYFLITLFLLIKCIFTEFYTSV